MEQNSKKWLWVLAAVVVLVVLGWWLWQGQWPVAPETAGTPAVSEDDTTAAIEQELQATDLGDIEKELQQTETDLQSL